MRFNTEEIAGSLCCPDDQRSLRSNDGTLRCCHCGRVYPVREGGILDLLPSKPAGSPANPEYAAYYHFEFYRDRKSTRLNSSHGYISYAVFCLKKKKKRNLTSKRGEVGYRMLTRAQLMDRQTHAIDSDAQLDAVQSDTYYLIVALGSLSPACSQQSCQSL